MILFHRHSEDLKDRIPHVFFIVQDKAATVAAVQAAGGTMAVTRGSSGITGGASVGLFFFLAFLPRHRSNSGNSHADELYRIHWFIAVLRRMADRVYHLHP